MSQRVEVRFLWGILFLLALQVITVIAIAYKWDAGKHIMAGNTDRTYNDLKEY
jgi:hypothetical protein